MLFVSATRTHPDEFSSPDDTWPAGPSCSPKTPSTARTLRFENLRFESLVQPKSNGTRPLRRVPFVFFSSTYDDWLGRVHETSSSASVLTRLGR